MDGIAYLLKKKPFLKMLVKKYLIMINPQIEKYNKSKKTLIEN